MSTVRVPIIALFQDFRSLVGNLNMISDGVMQMSLFCMQQRNYGQTLLIWVLGAIESVLIMGVSILVLSGSCY